jgi:drug/metabolite transporter (DMT)-like permease
MFWITLLALHLFGLVGYTILLRKSALGRIDKVLLAALMQTAVYIPVILLVIVNKGVRFDLAVWQWAMLGVSGLLLIGIQFLGIIALKHLETSLWSIIFNLRIVLTTVFGLIFLGELPTPLQITGGVVIFGSIIALNLHRHRRYASRPILIGVLITLFFSVHATIEKYNIVHIGFTEYMVISGGLATAALWLWVWHRKVRISHIVRDFDWHTGRLLALRSLSAWGYVLALGYGSLAVTNYASGMSVPLTVLLGVYFLNERDHLREKLTATFIAVIGLTLILIGQVTSM